MTRRRPDATVEPCYRAEFCRWPMIACSTRFNFITAMTSPNLRAEQIAVGIYNFPIRPETFHPPDYMIAIPRKIKVCRKKNKIFFLKCFFWRPS